MTVKRAFPIRQGYGTGLIGSVLMAGLVLVAPVAMGVEAGALVSRGEAATGSEASTSTPSTVPPWAQPCQPPLDCDAVRAQRIQRIRSGTLVRSMALVPDTVLEVYRDASGRLDVVERPRHVAADEGNGESPQAGVETVPGTVSGKLELVKKTTRPLHRTEFSRDPNGNTATEGNFCFEYSFSENGVRDISAHLVRASLRYVSAKDSKAVVAALK
ncbi:MAG: hypothetical protein WC995_03580 [Lysobacteraceae bacterium]